MKTGTRCFHGFIMLLALMGGISVAAAESVVVQRDSPLLESPAAGAAVVGAAAADDRLPDEAAEHPDATAAAAGHSFRLTPRSLATSPAGA